MKRDIEAKLQTLIGRELMYQGERCRLVEVLSAENALVLRVEGSEAEIQGNQFGEASRRAQRHHTVALFNEDRTLNPAIRALLG